MQKKYAIVMADNETVEIEAAYMEVQGDVILFRTGPDSQKIVAIFAVHAIRYVRMI